MFYNFTFNGKNHFINTDHITKIDMSAYRDEIGDVAEIRMVDGRLAQMYDEDVLRMVDTAPDAPQEITSAYDLVSEQVKVSKPMKKVEKGS